MENSVQSYGQRTAVKLPVCFNGLLGRPSLARRSDQKSSPLARPRICA